ncbi:NADH-quinone oxidoreductase subunit H, partial [Acinetobacter baumannii]
MNQEIIRQTPLWAENWPIAYAVVQAVVILLVVVLVAALMSFIERRLLAWWQDRYG